MKSTILVLTNSTDGVHSDIVISRLNHFGEKVFRFDADRIPTGDLKIKFCSSASHFDFEFQYAGQTVCSADIKSVWYRRPSYFNFKIKDVVQKRYAEDELKIFLEGLWHTMTQVFWLSDPQRLEIARKKVAQLKLAREIGGGWHFGPR